MSTVSRLLRRHGVQSDVIGRGRERRRRPTRVIGLPPRKISSRPKDRRNCICTHSVLCSEVGFEVDALFGQRKNSVTNEFRHAVVYDDILDVVR